MWTLLLLTGAVITDIRERRISNRMVCLGLLSGFYFQIWELGVRGSLIFIINVSFPVIVLYLLFLMRALGAGDIKLFSVIGSIWNFDILFHCIIFSFIVGAVMSLCKLFYNQNLLSRLNYFCSYIQEILLTGAIKVYDRQSDGKQNFIHFSIAILIGYLIALKKL